MSKSDLFLAALIASACASCGRSAPAPYAGFVDEPVAAVATQIPGKIASIPPREGDRVKKGDVLATLESSTYEAAVTQVEANLERAREQVKVAEANLKAAQPAVAGAGADIARATATRDQAERDYERAASLAKSGSVSPAEVDAAHARALEANASLNAMLAARGTTQGRLAASIAAISDANAGVRGAEAALELARAQLAQTRVTSPFDALVVSRNLEEGEWAAPGTPVVTVEDTSRPWVRLDVEETNFAGMKIGQPAAIHVIALGARTFRGHVAQIGAEEDFALNRDVKRGRPDVRTFLVRVAFDERVDELRPGMTAEVRLVDSAPRAPASGEAMR